jgi:predicted  nucleic acid-binding Zn-ribbon protein
MDICSHGHEEVCYESKSCPACDLLEQMKELEEQIKALEQDHEKNMKEIEASLEIVKTENEEMKEHVDLNTLRKNW